MSEPESGGRPRARVLDDAVEWFGTCYAEDDPDERHMHLSQYLVDAGDGNVLVDAGAGHGTDLVAALQERIDSLDAVLLTHAILPHTGNVADLRGAWPEATVVSTSPIPAAVGMEDSAPAVINDTETIAGDTFTFIDPLLTDVVVSTWIYHHESGTLFTAEGVGHYHASGECDRRSTEFPEGIPREYVFEFAADTLKFLEYVDPEKLSIAFETLLAEYDVRRFAPIHGTPVEGDDVEDYVDALVAVAGEF